MAHKILIVDDEPNIIISLEFLMKKEGFEVAVAVPMATKHWQKLPALVPDLMLLDVMMPKKSGFEVCEALACRPGQCRFADRHADRQGS
jgi:DNA-binding response OmpR family regulator